MIPLPEKQDLTRPQREDDHAAQDWQRAPIAVRSIYRDIARRWAEQTQFSIQEWAVEYGIRRDLLLCAVVSIGAGP
jgi:hypothetical protein